MARTRRGGKGGARATTVPASLTDSATTITAAASGLASWSGATTNGLGTATLNRGLADEETVTFAGISGNDLTTVTRGAAGTTAQAHAPGATLELTASFTDFDEANELVAAMATASAKAYNNADFSVPDATLTTVTLNAETWDTGGSMHSTLSNTSKVIAPIAGKYLVVGTVVWAANATGRRQIDLKHGGATTIASQMTTPGVSTAWGQTVSCIVTMAVNDYVELLAYQNSGGALNIATSSTVSPALAMTFLAF